MLLIVIAIVICLVALIPMVYDEPWNIKVAIPFFFFAYPVMHVAGFIGLLIMWSIAAAFIIIPKGDKHETP
jgi:hypothetical protein